MPKPSPLEPTAAFLAEAGPAIARAGGINPASLARLRAIAQKHGLSANQMSAAIKQLGRGKKSVVKLSAKAAPPPVPKAKPARKPKAFARFVREVLGPETALLPHQYDELTELAQTDYGLDSAQATRVMEDVLRERGGEYLPPEAAADALFERARELQSRGRLDVAAFGRLQTAADQAGLSREQFQEILDRAAKAGTPIPDSLYAEEEAIAPTHRRRSPVAMFLAGAFVLFVVVGAGGIGYAYFREEEKPPEAEPELTPALVEQPAPQPPPDPDKIPVPWGDAGVSAALEQAVKADPDRRDLWKDVASEAPAVREKAYRQLATDPVRLTKKGSAGVAALARFHAADPADEAARGITDKLTDVLPGPSPPVADTIRQWLAATELVAALLAVPELPAARGGSVVRVIEVATGGRFDAAAAEPSARATIALVGAAYTRLTDEAGNNPAAALTTHVAVAAELRAPIPAAADSKDFALLLAAVKAPTPDEAAATAAKPLIAACLKHEPSRALDLVTAYERAPATPLRTALENALLVHAKAERGTDAADTATAMKKALGAGTPADPRERARALARNLLFRAPPGADEPAAGLRDAVNLAHASTAVCALVGPPKANENRFDEIVRAVPDLTPPKKPAPPPPMDPPAPPAVPKIVGPFIRNGRLVPPTIGPAVPPELPKQIKLLSSAGMADRVAVLQAIAENVQNPDALDAEAAAAIAKYVLKPSLSKDEVGQIRLAIQPLAGSTPLLVAIADELQQVGGTQARIEGLLNVLMDPAPSIPAARPVAAARRAILLHATGGDLEATAALAAAKYRQLVQEQGQLLGMPAADFFLRTEPSAGLEGVIVYLSRQIVPDKVSAADRRFLEQLPHQAAVLSYLGHNDLQKTVLLQRTWFRTLRLYLAQRKPAAAAALGKLADEYAQEDKAATDTLARLRVGEVMALKAWLIALDAR